MFFLWGSVALGLCLWAFFDRPSSFLKLRPALIGVFVCVMAAFAFSLDPSTSLFPTLQAIVFIFTWLMLRGHPEWMQGKLFWRTLIVLGTVTLVQTLHQIIGGPNSAGLYETYGFLPSNPSFNGIWMASLSVAFIARALKRKQPATMENIVEILLGISLATLVIVNPARTRSAPLALCISLPYVFCVRFPVRKVALYTLLVAGLAFVCLPFSFLEAHARISGEHAEPNYRTRIWGVAVQSTRDHPLTGYGLGNFEMGYQKHAFPVKEDFLRFARTTQFAHNEYLNVAAEMGLPAFGLLVFLIITILRYPTSPNSAIQQPAKAALLTLCSDAFFNPTWHIPFLVYVTLLWSVCLVGPSETLPPSAPKRSPRTISFGSLLGILLVFVSTEGLLVYSAFRSVWASNGEWEQILKWNPYDASAWKARGDQLPISSEAVNAYVHAVTLCPAQPYFHESLAFALEHSPHPNDLRQAAEQYQIAFQLAPKRANNALAIGRLFYRQGNYTGSLVWFDQARQLEPNYWEAYLWIARSLSKTGHKAQAVRLLRALPLQRARFLDYQKGFLKRLRFYRPSGYEELILRYDSRVIEQELQRLVSPK